ncbi:MAG: tRNA (adenosine(37)-N6)-threonylcarbamoyltransferase complex ATPase subunit type 1 TsaE [Cryomorphaceae bacterium]
MQLNVSVPNLDQCDDLFKAFRNLYKERQVFAFRGELGSGKTTLIKKLCRDLGVTSEMSSPSFAIVNEYDSERVGSIFHFDLYRLKSERELIDIGWHDYLSQEKITFIEWPEMAGTQLPEDAVDVAIEVLDPSQHRILTITYQA